MRTKKIGDRSPLRVLAVSAKKIATLPVLLASLKSKGRLMIAKLGKRKQDDGSNQLIYKQIDDAIFAKFICHQRGLSSSKRGALVSAQSIENTVRPIGPRSKQRLRSARPRDMYHLASMKWMSWTYRCQPFPFPWKMLNLFAWNFPNFWSTLRLGFIEGSMKTMKQ